ncbi:Hypp2805 [Branchiostoma lanceolatum]|uniref:Hypp2805 protein n=1 Tax=Branchiostoma lanceolatum TaxID=7740 RepID=A0A8K0EUM5_BRALA|nr:Hypp2805 [Branchiostoma lanceolatum]
MRSLVYQTFSTVDRTIEACILSTLDIQHRGQDHWCTRSSVNQALSTGQLRHAIISTPNIQHRRQDH